MTDRIEFPLETSEGRRGPGSAGDRLMVAITVIALLGGAGILAGKVLDHSDAVALSSTAPSATPVVRTQAPTPIPTPSTFSVTAGDPPPLGVPGPPSYSGWVRALADLPIRTAPVAGANQIGAVVKGDAAYVEQAESAVPDGITWFTVRSGRAAGGFIAGSAGSRQLVRRFPEVPTPSAARVVGIATSPDLFIAYGYQASATSAAQRPLLARSVDGSQWEAMDPMAFGGRLPSAIAFGPAGWLAIAVMDPERASGTLWLWSSPDGAHWQSVGGVAGLGEGLYASQLVGNRTGYELSVYADSAPRQILLHSRDGLTWTTSQGLEGSFVRLTATASGFFAWPQDGPASSVQSAASVDGLTWTVQPGGPSGAIADVVGVGEELVAITTEASSLTPRAWSGSFENGNVLWSQEPPPAFSGGAIAALASDGQRVIAFGWQRSTLEPAVWFADGREWQRDRLPADAFDDGRTTLVAANAHGVVAVALHPTLQADDPVVWWATPQLAWQRTTVPGVTPVGEPTRQGCSSRPDDFLAFAALPAPKAIACFGARPFMFTAWAGLCADCNAYAPGTYTPRWLIGGGNEFTLAPVSSGDYATVAVQLTRTLVLNRGWASNWVRVTGHYDDPAASTCRYTPDPLFPDPPMLPAETIRQCRTSFVVTQVKVVAGP